LPAAQATLSGFRPLVIGLLRRRALSRFRPLAGEPAAQATLSGFRPLVIGLLRRRALSGFRPPDGREFQPLRCWRAC